MKFSLALPVDRPDAADEFVTGEAIADIARAAERAGFAAVFVTDHPIPERRWLEAGGHHTLDPFVALSFAAAATKRVRLQTNLCVLPYRNPYLLAKAVATLDNLSGGRVLLGVGVGYLKPEFAALGVDFEQRNELGDEAVVAMKRAWSGEPFAIGDHEHVSLPRPLQSPPKMWGGGNSKRAIRRAVEHCAGWMPFPNPPKAVDWVRTPALLDLEELRRRLDYAGAHADKVGRTTPLDVQYGPIMRYCYGQDGFEAQQMFDQIGAQTELGVGQWPIIFERTGRGTIATRARYMELIEGFGSDIIGKL